MIVDTSALLAILLDEPDSQRCADALRNAENRTMSAVSVFETATVLLRRKGPEGVTALMRLLRAAGIQVADFDAEQMAVAIDAYARFGKRVASPGLNFGDCPVYALARLRGEAVLSTSDEFVRAGLDPASD